MASLGKKLKLKLRVGDIIEVAWDDHCGYNQGWQESADIPAKGLVVCTCVGYFLHLDKSRVLISQSLDEQGKSNHHMAVGRGMLRGIKILKRSVTKRG